MEMEDEIKWSTNIIKDDGDTLLLSELSVLESAAGWYIGYLCKTIKCRRTDENPGCVEPYERTSDYMSYEQATKYLETLRK